MIVFEQMFLYCNRNTGSFGRFLLTTSPVIRVLLTPSWWKQRHVSSYYEGHGSHSMHVCACLYVYCRASGYTQVDEGGANTQVHKLLLISGIHDLYMYMYLQIFKNNHIHVVLRYFLWERKLDRNNHIIYHEIFIAAVDYESYESVVLPFSRICVSLTAARLLGQGKCQPIRFLPSQLRHW